MALKKQVLIVSQVIPQWYVDVLAEALGEGVHIDIITGSNVRGNVIKSPKHEADSLKSRLVCWYRHFRFVNQWIKENQSIHYDLVFAVSNPPINSYLGLKLKKKFQVPFIYMNWDIYPQVIESTIKNPAVKVICRLWHEWNSVNYPQINQMLTIGEQMAVSINNSLREKIKITCIPIAADIGLLQPMEKQENPFCQEYGLCDKFIVLYSGKMGMGHNIEVILEAARVLQNQRKICFVFIGNGPKYPMVEQFIKENQTENIKLFPLQPDNIFPYSMACGDIGIVTQEASMAHLFMPSKVYSMMACGEAIVGICTNKDDLYSLLENNPIGIAVTDESADTLAREILHLYMDKVTLERYKKCARITAEEKFSSITVTKQYKELFKRYMLQGEIG